MFQRKLKSRMKEISSPKPPYFFKQQRKITFCKRQEQTRPYHIKQTKSKDSLPQDILSNQSFIFTFNVWTCLNTGSNQDFARFWGQGDLPCVLTDWMWSVHTDGIDEMLDLKITVVWCPLTCKFLTISYQLRYIAIYHELNILYSSYI